MAFLPADTCTALQPGTDKNKGIFIFFIYVFNK